METKAEPPSSMRVGSGSFASSDLKNTTKLGEDEDGQDDDNDDRHDQDDARIDHRRNELGPGLDVALDVVGQLVSAASRFPVISADSRMPT